MNQIFTFAGVSRKHSELRLRTSNRPEYVDILIKEGHTDVDIISLPSPMGKDALVLHLLNSDFIIDNDEARDALVLEATKRKLPGYAKARKSEEVQPEEPAVEAEAEVQPAAEEDNVIILEQEVKPRKAKKSSKAADAVTAWAEAVAEEQAA
jgi:hypothetical protein